MITAANRQQMRLGVSPPVDYQFNSANHWSAGTVSSTTTWSSAPLGTASSDRIVVVSVLAGTGGTPTVTAVTVGGVSLTLAVGPTDYVSREGTIWWGSVPSGTTGNVVFTVATNPSSQRMSAATYSLYNASYVVDTGSQSNNDTSPDTISFTSEVDGCFVGNMAARPISTYTGSGALDDEWAWYSDNEFAHSSGLTDGSDVTISVTSTRDGSMTQGVSFR